MPRQKELLIVKPKRKNTDEPTQREREEQKKRDKYSNLKKGNR